MDAGKIVETAPGCKGDYGGVDGVMAVVGPVLLAWPKLVAPLPGGAVGKFFQQIDDSPMASQFGRELALDAEHVMIGLEEASQVFTGQTGNVARVVELPLDEVVQLQLLLKKPTILGIGNPAVPHQPAGPLADLLIPGGVRIGQPLIGRAVALVGVGSAKTDRFVVLRIVKRPRARKNVIDLDFPAEQLCEADRLSRVDAFLFLVFPEKVSRNIVPTHRNTALSQLAGGFIPSLLA